MKKRTLKKKMTKIASTDDLHLTPTEDTPVTARTGVFANREDELYALLAEQTFLFTMGESSSIAEENAKELIRGIKYCIELHVRMHGNAGAALKTLFSLGRDDVRRLANRGRLLLAQAKTRLPPVVNKAYSETLEAVRDFFGNYDDGLFAHAVPCEIVYPLCCPIDDSLQGIEYINAYLRALNTEADFLRLFDAETLTALYKRTFPDFDELVVGLYAPAAEAAVGRALLCLPPDRLTINDSEMGAILKLIAAAADDAEKVKAMLSDAASRVCLGFGTGERTTEYLIRAAEDMAPRLIVMAI